MGTILTYAICYVKIHIMLSTTSRLESTSPWLPKLYSGQIVCNISAEVRNFEERINRKILFRKFCPGGRQDDPTGPARKRGQQVRGSRSVVSGDMENVDEGGGESVSSSSTPDAEGGDEDMSTASEG